MVEDIVVKIEGADDKPAEPEHKIEKENDEWMILLGELKANQAMHSAAMAELKTEVDRLTASLKGVEEGQDSYRQEMKGSQSELFRRLELLETMPEMEEMEEVEEVEEVIPEVESVEEEKQEQTRKRPRLIE